MLEKYGIKETIPTRTNDLFLSDFSSVPTFEGKILVYEKSLAGAQLKTYGAGVNVYVNEEIAQQQPKLRPLLIRVHMNLLELILPKS